jgi:hypothetical protein
MFSRIMDRAVDCQFKRDPYGRVVFIPFTLKGKCYFVDSKSDEEKLRGFVKVSRAPLTLISWLTFPITYIPAVILDTAGLTPRAHRLAIALGIPLFFWLMLGVLAGLTWLIYKKTVPGVTASLSEVGPEAKTQLRELSAQPRRVALRVILGCLVILILLIAGVLGWHRVRKKNVSVNTPGAIAGSPISPID